MVNALLKIMNLLSIVMTHFSLVINSFIFWFLLLFYQYKTVLFLIVENMTFKSKTQFVF